MLAQRRRRWDNVFQHFATQCLVFAEYKTFLNFFDFHNCCKKIKEILVVHGVSALHCTARPNSPAVSACLGVDPLDMPRTPYRASEGKRSQ